MARKRSDIKFDKILLMIVIIAVVLAAIAFQFSKPKACTMEAKICPDGSAVGRVPPNCDFAPCPSEPCICPNGYVQDGNVCNPRCYYSTPKCLAPSLSCSSTCNSDSDCVGAECCHPTSCINKAYKGVCNLLCTQVCQGPLDCGAGSCECVNNRCTVIPK